MVQRHTHEVSLSELCIMGSRSSPKSGGAVIITRGCFYGGKGTSENSEFK